nr:CsbD family protein [Tessaracoccus sp. MC1679]
MGTRQVTIYPTGGIVGADDKIRNAAEEAGGKVKEGLGKATDNERLEAEGKADQVSADIKQATEKVKDVFK